MAIFLFANESKLLDVFKRNYFQIFVSVSITISIKFNKFLIVPFCGGKVIHDHDDDADRLLANSNFSLNVCRNFKKNRFFLLFRKFSFSNHRFRRHSCSKNV